MSETPEPAPERFTIEVDQRVLDDLHVRLRKTRWTHTTQDAGWELGTSRRYLHELADYWANQYDWREQEAALNALPHFMARVERTDMHFLHVRGRGTMRTPLLLLHGWPDSFLRFHKVLGRLAEPSELSQPDRGGAHDAFDVVVPSLPGFAFTGPAQRVSSVQPTRYSAQLLWQLMTEVLGYERFIVAGGDGGSVLAQLIAIDHPESVLGVHLTDLGWHALDGDPESLSRPERKYMDATRKALQADGAYALVHMTQPRSLAASLNDSPVGLASWIVDRFHSWCDCGAGELEDVIARDDLLTNIMLYWVTQTIGASIFNYHAEAQSPSLSARDRVERPVGLLLSPKDIGGIPPRSLAERTLDVHRWTELPHGGHFAALEQPTQFVDDIVAFARMLRSSRLSVEVGQEVRHGM